MGGSRSVAGRHAGLLIVVVAFAVAGVGAWPAVLGAGAATSPDFSVIAGGSTTPPTSGGTPALETKLAKPQDVAADAGGNLVICDTDQSEVEVLAESPTNPGYLLGSGATWTVGSLYVIAGDPTRSPAPVTTGSPGASTGLDDPEGIAVDDGGNILIADTGDDEVEVVAVSPANPGYVLGTGATWARGDLYVIAGRGTGEITPIPRFAGAPATADGLNAPAGVGVDGAGNVLIADSGHGLVEALAVGSSKPGYATAPSDWVEGDLYAIAGPGSDSPSVDGTPGLSTVLDQPSGVAIDSSGNVFIADSDDLMVEVLAGSATDPGYLLGSGAVWTAGDLYVIAGGGTSPPSASGMPADETGLDLPVGVATDAAGNLLVAEGSGDQVDILAVSSSDPGYELGSGATWLPGDLYVLAGGGIEAPSASGTDALSTQLGQTDGVAVSPSGGIAVADSGDSEVGFLVRAPVPPALASATPGDQTVTLTWSPPASDGGSPISGYDVLVFAGGSAGPLETLVVGADTASCIVGGLTDGGSYSFEVDAFSVVGTSQPSSALGAVPESTSASTTTSPVSGVTPPLSGSVTTTTSPVSGVAPTSGSRRPGVAKLPLARVMLTKRTAPVRSGFATLEVRCNARLCGGELQLTAHKVVRLTSHGRTRKVVETVLVSSDHFSIRGGVVVPLPVPVMAHAIAELTAARHYRVLVAATFVVKKGAKSCYKIRLVGA